MELGKKKQSRELVYINKNTTSKSCICVYEKRDVEEISRQ